MKILFYGTGASEAVPSLFCNCKYCQEIRKLGGKNYRSRTSTQINQDMLIDFSADAFDHMRSLGLNLVDIKYLIITHSHTDHLYPEALSQIAPPFNKSDTIQKLIVYGNEKVLEKIYDAVEPSSLEYLDLRIIRNMEEVNLGQYAVKALPAMHDPSEECHLYIIRENGKNLLYAHDTAYFSETIWKELEKETHLDCVVLDCTCCNGPSYFNNHMGFEDNIRIRDRMLKSGIADQSTKFISTHFVHTFGPIQGTMESAFAPHHFFPAFDGYSIEI